MFEASAVVQGGSSAGAHNRQLADSAAKHGVKLAVEDAGDDSMNPGVPPPGFGFVWDAFLDLSASRAYGFGPCPIAYRDIESWCRLNRLRLKVWQVDLIHRLDTLWMEVRSEAKK